MMVCQRDIFGLTCILLLMPYVQSHSLYETRADPSVCSQGGYICVDGCTELVLCVELGNNNYQALTLDYCNTTYENFCNAETRDCSGQYCLGGSKQTFTCQATGTFPDPYNCQKYYYCDRNGANGVPYTCKDQTAFNAGNGFCDLGLDSRPCKEGPVPPCTAPGDSGAVPENKNLFYVCQIETSYLVPKFYACSPNLEYNEALHTCLAVTTAPSSSTSDTSSSSPSPGETTTPSDVITTTPAPDQDGGDIATNLHMNILLIFGLLALIFSL